MANANLFRNGPKQPVFKSLLPSDIGDNVASLEDEQKRLNAETAQIELFFAVYIVAAQRVMSDENVNQPSVDSFNEAVALIAAIRDTVFQQLRCSMSFSQNDPFFGNRSLPVLVPTNNPKYVSGTEGISYADYLSRLDAYYPGSARNFINNEYLMDAIKIHFSGEADDNKHYLVMPEPQAVMECIYSHNRALEANRY